MYFWTLKRVLTWLIAGSFIGFILFYAYYQSRGVMGGPVITLTSPVDGTTVSSALVDIVGSVTHAKELILDGRAIFIDTHGRFYEQLLLAPGYNIIELTARDGEGRETRKTLEIMAPRDNGGAYFKERGQATTTSTSTP